MSQDFDPCECVFSHAGAMRRLISLLRDSQGYCTNEECFTNPPGPAAASQGGDNTFMMLTMGWVLLALILFFMRPASLTTVADQKPRNNQGPNHPPPDNSVE